MRRRRAPLAPGPWSVAAAGLSLLSEGPRLALAQPRVAELACRGLARGHACSYALPAAEEMAYGHCFDMDRWLDGSGGSDAYLRGSAADQGKETVRVCLQEQASFDAFAEQEAASGNSTETSGNVVTYAGSMTSWVAEGGWMILALLIPGLCCCFCLIVGVAYCCCLRDEDQSGTSRMRMRVFFGPDPFWLRDRLSRSRKAAGKSVQVPTQVSMPQPKGRQGQKGAGKGPAGGGGKPSRLESDEGAAERYDIEAELREAGLALAAQEEEEEEEADESPRSDHGVLRPASANVKVRREYSRPKVRDGFGARRKGAEAVPDKWAAAEAALDDAGRDEAPAFAPRPRVSGPSAVGSSGGAQPPLRTLQQVVAPVPLQLPDHAIPRLAARTEAGVFASPPTGGGGPFRPSPLPDDTPGTCNSASGLLGPQRSPVDRVNPRRLGFDDGEEDAFLSSGDVQARLEQALILSTRSGKRSSDGGLSARAAKPPPPAAAPPDVVDLSVLHQSRLEQAVSARSGKRSSDGGLSARAAKPPPPEAAPPDFHVDLSVLHQSRLEQAVLASARSSKASARGARPPMSARGPPPADARPPPLSARGDGPRAPHSGRVSPQSAQPPPPAEAAPDRRRRASSSETPSRGHRGGGGGSSELDVNLPESTSEAWLCQICGQRRNPAGQPTCRTCGRAREQGPSRKAPAKAGGHSAAGRLSVHSQEPQRPAAAQRQRSKWDAMDDDLNRTLQEDVEVPSSPSFQAAPRAASTDSSGSSPLASRLAFPGPAGISPLASSAGLPRLSATGLPAPRVSLSRVDPGGAPPASQGSSGGLTLAPRRG